MRWICTICELYMLVSVANAAEERRAFSTENAGSGTISAPDDPDNSAYYAEGPITFNTESNQAAIAESSNSSNVEEVLALAKLSTLEAALIAATGFSKTELCRDCNYTFFAPTDEAFASFVDADLWSKLLTPQWSFHLQELLSFHLTADRRVSSSLTNGLVLEMRNNESIVVESKGASFALTSDYTNQSQVLQADLTSDYGIWHTIDAVLLPEFVVTNLYAYAFTEHGRDFTSYIDLHEFLNLPPLCRENDFTIFAPANEAFVDLSNATLESLRNQSNSENTIRTILNHAVGGVLPSTYFQDGLYLETEGGFQLRLSLVDDGTWMVNDAKILRTNMLANNGIIHAIDKLLLPTNVSNSINTPTVTPALAPRAPNDASASTGSNVGLNSVVTMTALFVLFFLG